MGERKCTWVPGKSCMEHSGLTVAACRDRTAFRENFLVKKVGWMTFFSD